jgi:SAM-dependent methyltransferase
MSKHFTKAIGTDPSAGMIKTAQERNIHQENLTFRQASAESLPFLQDGEADCIIAAEAAHWFDYEKLWPELARVLRSEGTVAFWGYKDHLFVDYPHASEVLAKYAYGSHPDMLGSYWQQPGRSYLQDQLRVVKPPGDTFGDVTRVEYEPGVRGKRTGDGTCFIEKTISVGACKEYVRTWSAYHSWLEAHPEKKARSQGGEGDVVDLMFDEIAEKAEHFREDDNLVDVEWGSALVMARKK